VVLVVAVGSASLPLGRVINGRVVTSTRARSPSSPRTDVRPRVIEVLPAVDQAQGPALSDEAVANILELVVRDTRMLARTALQRPLPVVWDLMSERSPIAAWYVQRKVDQCALQLNEELASCSLIRCMAPRAAEGLSAERARLERRLEHSRTTLWPTLRALLLTPAMHQRVVSAARTQLAVFKEQHSRQPRAWWQSPQRVLLLWAALWRWGAYGMSWLCVCCRPAGFGFLLSAEKRQRVRKELIESAVRKGLELQRRVEMIEETPRPLLPSGKPTRSTDGKGRRAPKLLPASRGRRLPPVRTRSGLVTDVTSRGGGRRAGSSTSLRHRALRSIDLAGDWFSRPTRWGCGLGACPPP